MFLGWDCAHKTLAWSYVKVNLSIINDMCLMFQPAADIINSKRVDKTADNKLPSDNKQVDQLPPPKYSAEEIKIIEQTIDNLLLLTGGFITMISGGVKDVVDGRLIKDVNEMDRTKALYQFLHSMAPIDVSTQVIIERQPPKIVMINPQSAVVGHQLAFYSLGLGLTSPPLFIDSKLKNTICFGKDLSYDHFLGIAIPRNKTLQAARYSARKKHTKENVKYMAAVFGWNLFTGVKKACYDDLADSLMEIFAFIRENKLLG
jgi:hypothetical protein